MPWTLRPRNIDPMYVQQVLGELPSLRGRVIPSIGDDGEVEAVGNQMPQWMSELAEVMDAEDVGFDIERT